MLQQIFYTLIMKLIKEYIILSFIIKLFNLILFMWNKCDWSYVRTLYINYYKYIGEIFTK